LAAIGRLASGVAHEVKNPLGIIMGGMEYLEHKLSSVDDETRSDMKKVREAVKRADAVVQGLLKFSRPSDLKIEKINPNDMVNSALSLLQYKIQLANIKVRIELSGPETTVEVDRAQIEQVLINVLLNAMDAMPMGGQITVTAGSGVIEIRDEGEGISAHDLSKVFEPFFTTKRDKKGTGLGLYISRMIVENHHGKMLIESELGKGTLVRITLLAGA
jgi:signal transduction histidine kinase